MITRMSAGTGLWDTLLSCVRVKPKNWKQTDRSVLYAQPSAEERFDREVALLREKEIRVNSARRDMMLGLPHAVQISTDGEEDSYNYYQQSLRVSRDLSCDTERAVRPPPNRTIYDSDSPPPGYQSNSPSYSLREDRASSLSFYCNGWPHTRRCHSMSNPCSSLSSHDRSVMSSRDTIVTTTTSTQTHYPTHHGNNTLYSDELDRPPDYSCVTSNTVSPLSNVTNIVSPLNNVTPHLCVNGTQQLSH